MFTLEQVFEIHNTLIVKYGGSIGVREQGLLESALERPFGGFGDFEFYPTPEQKAAAILESIVKNHPFIDGNKRTGYTLMRMVLRSQKKDIVASEDEKYDFVIKVASGEMEFEEIVTWIQHKMTDL